CRHVEMGGRGQGQVRHHDREGDRERALLARHAVAGQEHRQAPCPGFGGDMKVSLEADDDDEGLNALTIGMRTFNRAAVPGTTHAKIVAAVRDDEGKVVGGVIGRLASDSVYVEIVYNDEDVRGSGMGSKAMRLVEEEAKRLGATEAWLYTMSFQAKP